MQKNTKYFYFLFCLTELEIGFDAMSYFGSEGEKVNLIVSVITSANLSETVTVSVRFRTVDGTAEGEF